jgi:hypothetical protein
VTVTASEAAAYQAGVGCRVSVAWRQDERFGCRRCGNGGRQAEVLQGQGAARR